MSCKKKKLCTGELTNKIRIVTSCINYQSYSNNSNINFELLVEVYAKVVTKSGYQYLDGVNLISTNNIEFWFNWINLNFDQQLWVEFSGNRYKCSNVQNKNLDNLIIVLTCDERGGDTIESAKI